MTTTGGNCNYPQLQQPNVLFSSLLHQLITPMFGQWPNANDDRLLVNGNANKQKQQISF